MTDLKKQAAQKAFEFVQDGMVLGLGSGSTAFHFVELLGEKLRLGGLRSIQGVPTSEATASQARRLGIPLTTISKDDILDLAVDGADEVDANFDLIKGLGKALLREKMIEIHARQFLVIVDESKLVNRLGTRDALPVEIVRFEWKASIHWLNSLGCIAELWRNDDGEPWVTDNGNYLARCWFGGKDPGASLSGIPDPYELARRLADHPGIVEHGLFLGMATHVIVAGVGGCRIMERKT
jgi:ribose 5-phosphate isomerase A